MVREPPRALQLLHRRPVVHRLDVDRHVRHGGIRRRARRSPPNGRQRVGGHRPHVDLELGLVAHDVRAGPGLEHADVRRHVRPAAVQRVDLPHELGAGDDRAAALLGLDTGVRGATVDREADVGHALARRDEVAARARALEHERRVDLAGLLAMCGVEDGDPISSSGLATNVIRSNGSASRQPPRSSEGGDWRAGPEQAGLHVADAGPLGDRAPASSIRNGRFATVPSAKTVSMCPIRRMRGPDAGRALERADHGVAVPAVRVRPALDDGAHRREVRRDPRPDLVHARRGVAAAVDRAESLEVVEERRQAGVDGRSSRRQLVRGDERSGRGGEGHGGSLRWIPGRVGRRCLTRCYPRRTVRLIEIRLLEGPNLYRLEPVVKLEVAIGRRRTWYGRREPEPHMLVRLGAAVPGACCRRASPRCRVGAPSAPRAPRRPAGAVLVHRSSDPGHWIVDVAVGGGRSREGHRGVGARPRRARGPVEGRGSRGRGRQRLLARVTASIEEAHGAGPT